ncbi:MAG: hypothetical protein JWP74_3744 [Marmoricola sp.]|nr:hypothetical protein [Marmoricola sp.]
MPDPDEDTSWYDDLRCELAQQWLEQAVVQASLEEIDLPHIVVCRDAETGTASYSGPFPNGIAALSFADREIATDRDGRGGAPFDFTVAALYPARALGTG